MKANHKQYIKSRNFLTASLSIGQYNLFQALLKSKATYNILNAGRQSGKTYTLARLATTLSIINGNEKLNTLVVAPYNSQVDTFFLNILQIEGVMNLIANIKVSPYKTIIFKNGSILDLRSADNPKSIRSKSYNYIFLDEFAFFKEDAFDLAIVPTLIASGNSCKLVFSSTPNGLTGQFYEMVQKGKDINEIDYAYYYINYNDNPKRNLGIIKKEYYRLPTPRFNQEFLGMFESDGGGVFTNFEDLCTIKKTMPSIKGGKYFAGIDWGKADDSTVLTILNDNKETVFSEAFKGDWVKQANDLGLVLNDYRPLVYAESNGVGDPAIEHLKQYYGNVKSFIMSNQSKKEIVEGLRMSIMKQEILLQSKKYNSAQYIQLSNYTYSLTKTGLITYHHRPNEYDDYVDSLAMANYAYDKHNKQFKGVRINKRSNFYN